MTVQMKKCTKCGELLPRDMFHATKRNPDGSIKYLASWCKQCHYKSQREKAGERVKPIPIITDDGKECLECRLIKPVSEFSPASRGRLGVSSYCKPCQTKRTTSSEYYKINNAAQTRRWRAENSELHRAQHRLTQFKRRTGIKAVNDGTLTSEVLKQIYAKEICYWCDKFIERDDRTLEHIVELSEGGIHGISNATMACRSCNSARKGRQKLKSESE